MMHPELALASGETLELSDCQTGIFEIASLAVAFMRGLSDAAPRALIGIK